MKKIYKRNAIILIVAAVFLSAAAVAFTAFINSPPHLFSGNECLECHFTIPNAEDARPFRFNKSINELCRRCHEGLPALSHSVGMVPTMQMPPGMPLDPLGMMDCATCHDPHKNRVNPKTGKKTYYLRVDRQGRAFCLLCHEDPKRPGLVKIFSASGAVTHRRSMTRTHGFANFSVVDEKESLDPVSLLCIRCHGADESTVDLEKLGSGVYWMKGSGIGLSHPVGTDYEDAAWRNRELIGVKELDGRIKLFNGKVGCCTCHNPYSNGGGEGLAIGMKGSYQELCLACHNL